MFLVCCVLFLVSCFLCAVCCFLCQLESSLLFSIARPVFVFAYSLSLRLSKEFKILVLDVSSKEFKISKFAFLMLFLLFSLCDMQ